MHDYLMSIVNDSIDENIKVEIERFHIETNNRQLCAFTSYPIVKTLLSNEQIYALEKKEHSFSTEKIVLSSLNNSLSFSRKASATRMEKFPLLDKGVFESLINRSFGAFTFNDISRYPYPSGGAFYSGQVIVYLKNVAEYEVGAYHYLPISNQLEKLHCLDEDIIEKHLFINHEIHFNDYDFFILYSSLMDKHVCKYGYRGYRLAILEIGSMYRNLEVEAQFAGLQSRVWGGFNDEGLSISLGIDPRVLPPVICQIVGRS